MRAVILAGGKGTRLAPYTAMLPKPLMPIDDMPIIEIVIRQLRHYGVDHVTMAVGHLAELLMTFLGDGERFGLRIDYSREDKPLGTAAPLLLVDNLPETFLVMNGDLLTTIDYRRLFETHTSGGAELTIATHERDVRIDLGVLETDDDGRVSEYHEKPTIHYTASMGVYVFDRRALDHIPSGAYFDFPDLIQAMAPERTVATYQHNGLWLDIGRHEDFEEAQRLFDKHRDEFLPGAKA